MNPSEPTISRSVALHYRVLPIGFEENTLMLITDRPIDEDRILELKRLCDSPIAIRHVDKKTFSDRLNSLYGVGVSALSPSVDTVSRPNGLTDGTVVRFVAQILDEAQTRNASDIHLESGPSEFRIRLRVDGLMQSVPVPEDMYPLRTNITARIKVLAGLDPTPSREPKDGRIKHGNRDLRVSILPALHGESVHLRFLTPPGELPDLYSLGLSHDERDVLLEAMKTRGGLIIACGPTGSGKSTTLHALLKEGVPRTVKVITVEDPVEYELADATQIEVTTKFPFSRTLRSVLRHDPDVILIGEIRDPESAVIALESALTGHLVLTSLHTDTEIQAIGRFRQFGVPFALVASALHLLVSQRLVRIVCNSCNGTGTLESSHECKRCNGSGYRGRRGMFRILPISESLREAIATENVRNLSRIIEDMDVAFAKKGQALVESGITTHEEILRVLGPEE